MKKGAFTLIELIIVVSILGILAAIVIPQVEGNTVIAKESAALSSLRTLRSQISLYKLEHDDFPGYVNGTAYTTESFFTNQIAGISSAIGTNNSATVATETFPYGPYMSEIPENPLNGYSDVKIFTTTATLASEADDTTGWLYKAVTGEICLNTTSLDNAETKNYYDY